MGRKIKRRRHSFSRRRSFSWKGAGLIALCGLLIVGGFFSGKLILDTRKNPPSDDSSLVQSDPAPTEPPPTQGSQELPDSPSLQPVRALYLPFEALLDRQQLDSQLEQAAAAGFNALVFDVKDEQGALSYQSATPAAVKAGNAAAAAISREEMQNLFAHLKEKGFTALPRLFCFKDPLAARELEDAHILLKGEPNYLWLDNTAAKGGKPWLNPYAESAHMYLIELAKELKELGAETLMLDGVQFPDQTYLAAFGSTSMTSLAKDEVLKKFVADLTAAIEGCNVILCAPGLASLSEKTAAFGGNPLTLSSATVAPELMPGTLGNRLKAGNETLQNPAGNPGEAIRISLDQIRARVQVMPEESRPALLPWLQAEGCTAEQITAQINAVTAQLGASAPYILYHSKGTYAFETLT